MTSKEVLVNNKLGLHARAAAKLVTLASDFKADIQIAHNGKQVNGKSIMGVMMLAASKGTRLEIIASGEDEQQAVDKIISLINDKFGEDS